MRFELTDTDIHILNVAMQFLLEQDQETPEQQAYRIELAKKIDQIERKMTSNGIEKITLQGEH